MAITAFLALLGAAAATSGVNRWSPSGLGGVSISRIAIDPWSPWTREIRERAVTDTVTGATRVYRSVSSAAGQLCGGVDTSAFR